MRLKQINQFNSFWSIQWGWGEVGGTRQADYLVWWTALLAGWPSLLCALSASGHGAWWLSLCPGALLFMCPKYTPICQNPPFIVLLPSFTSRWKSSPSQLKGKEKEIWIWRIFTCFASPGKHAPYDVVPF